MGDFPHVYRKVSTSTSLGTRYFVLCTSGDIAA